MSNLLAPHAIRRMGPRACMMLGGTFYVLMLASLIHVEKAAFITASAFNGVGAALLWTAEVRSRSRSCRERGRGQRSKQSAPACRANDVHGSHCAALFGRHTCRVLPLRAAAHRRPVAETRARCLGGAGRQQPGLPHASPPTFRSPFTLGTGIFWALLQLSLFVGSGVALAVVPSNDTTVSTATAQTLYICLTALCGCGVLSFLGLRLGPPPKVRPCVCACTCVCAVCDSCPLRARSVSHARPMPVQALASPVRRGAPVSGSHSAPMAVPIL